MPTPPPKFTLIWHILYNVAGMCAQWWHIMYIQARMYGLTQHLPGIMGTLLQYYYKQCYLSYNIVTGIFQST